MDSFYASEMTTINKVHLRRVRSYLCCKGGWARVRVGETFRRKSSILGA